MRFDTHVRGFVAALALSFGLSCGSDAVLHPTFPDGGLLAQAEPFPPKLLSALEGMYTIAGDGPLSGEVALHAAPAAGTLSIFGQASDAYAILKAGCLDGGARVVFEGAWRHPRTTDTGLVRLFLDDASLAHALCASISPGKKLAPAKFAGVTGSGARLPDEPVALTFERALVDPGGRFVVAAHHGACRTIDDCGASENSLESIRLVESFGASVVELDVRVTKDGVPILYHDDNFTPRLSKGTFCHGPVSSFTFADIRAHCRLLYGEEIPKLDDALDVALHHTNLVGVWLDLKVPEAVVPAIALAAKYNGSAKKLAQRTFGAVVGLGEEELLSAYEAAPNRGDAPCLVELEPDDVRRLDCHLWGPRWTRGPMAAEVRALQNEGRAVVYWTIDEPGFLDVFLTEGRPNGVLSDRPGLVFQRFQALGVMPEGNVKP